MVNQGDNPGKQGGNAGIGVEIRGIEVGMRGIREEMRRIRVILCENLRVIEIRRSTGISKKKFKVDIM